jgi:hypothetical protein
MARIFGVQGRVTSWTGYDGLVQSVKQNTISFSTNAPELDTTGALYNASGDIVSSEFIAGLRNATMTMTSWLNPAIKGNEGGLTITTAGQIYGDGAGVQTYNLSINIPEGRSTAFDPSGTGITEESYIPGPYNWQASFTGYYDDAVALVLAGGQSVCTFKIREDTADHTIAGTAIATALTPTIDPNSISTMPITLRGTGGLTVAGTANTLLPSGALGAFTVGAIEFQLNDGTLIESSAFPTSINIAVDPSQAIQVTTNIRLTGGLSINPTP